MINMSIVKKEMDDLIDRVKELSSNMFVRNMYNELITMMVKINKGLELLENKNIGEAEKVFREILRDDVPNIKKSVLLIMSYIDMLTEISKKGLRFIEEFQREYSESLK